MPGFVRRERKHKKVARARDESTSNTNAEVLLPESLTARDERRQALRDEIRAGQPESKVSSKKRKRLDKYIETKLRKEEAADLVRKLEEQKVDTSLLQSSKTLGRVHESQRDKLSRIVQETKAGISDGQELLQPSNRTDNVNGDSDSDSESHDSGDESGDKPMHIGAVLQKSHPQFGSGLKRPFGMDERGQPVIKKRKRRRVEKACDIHSDPSEDEEEWEGFSADEKVEAALSSDGEPQGSSVSLRSDSPDADEETSARPAVSAFKAWADNLRNAALDFKPSTSIITLTSDDKIKQNFKPRPLSPEPLLQEAISHDGLALAPVATITVHRSEGIQAARLELPVVQEEQKVVEAITRNSVVVICGATGSGKTTQIPQILFENGYGSRIGETATSNTKSKVPPPQSKGIIGVTQPRRVAATSVASRVQDELGAEYGRRVAHQVRYDTNVRKDTAIKFMTDGILLREIQNDYILSKYSVIVLDEAHERIVNTDILIGMLARIIPLRLQISKEHPDRYYPLKLVIMSATLSHGVNSFLQNERLWKPCGGPPPVVSVEGRQYPVTVHFARKTRRDYVNEVVEKVVRGHLKLPPGGFLVFLTGQQEIQTVMKTLREKIGGDTGSNGHYRSREDYDDEDGLSDNRERPGDFLEDELSNPDSDSEAEIETTNEAEFEISAEPDRPHDKTFGALKPYILPLYAALPQAQQQKVFQPIPSGTRQIVLSTNVAETSLTIPGIRYVFDTGRAKQKHYNKSTGIQTFEVGLISRASAEQRKGRAGRTGPGHVWRLYSSNVYEELFAEETTPEILRTGLESVVLQLKSMDIKTISTFPFPTAPEETALKKAEDLLRHLGAVEKSTITQVGKNIMKFPVHPRFGVMLLLAQSNNLVAHTIALVAGLATGELFMPEFLENQSRDAQDKEADAGEVDYDVRESKRRMEAKICDQEAKQHHHAYTKSQSTLSKWDDKSDSIKTLVAIVAHADPECHNGHQAKFCKDYWLREKGMAEVQLLRRQLHSIVHGSMERFEEKLSLPREKDFALLKQLVAAGFIDQVAMRSDLLPNYTSSFGRKPKKATEVAYRTLLPSLSSSETPEKFDRLESYEKEILRSVFVHPSSILTRLSVSEMPEYLIYSHLSRAATSSIGDEKVKKTRFHPLTPVSSRVLGALAEGTPLIQLGKPIGKIGELPTSATPTGDGEGQPFGGRVQRRECWISVSLKAPGSFEQEWPLPPWKVVQKKTSGKEWEVEKILAR